MSESELSLPQSPSDTLRLDAEQSIKVLHSAQFLQSDLQALLKTPNPIVAELVLREIEVVISLIERMQYIEAMVRAKLYQTTHHA
jgi:hypothetical protein